MEQELYVLFTCDEWKSRDSMWLLGVFDENKIKVALKKLLKQNDIELGTDKSIDEIEVDELNDYVTYAYIEQVDLNDMHNVQGAYRYMELVSKLEQQVGDILITVDFIGEQGGKNVYEITLENKKGKTISYYFNDSIRNTYAGVPITIDRVVEGILNDCETNSKTYTNYYDFAYDYNFERFDKKSEEYKEGKAIYKERVKFGNDLNKVISQDWIDSMKTYFKLS